MTRLVLLASLLLLLALSGCGGDMTAEELEERLSNPGETVLGLTKYEDVECRQSSAWDFECTFTLTQGLVSTISSELAMGFMVDGDELKCGTGPMPAASALPSPGEICPQLAR